MSKHIFNSAEMVKDVMHGDPTVDFREDYQELTLEDMDSAVKLILSNPSLSEDQKAFYLKNSWKIHYKGDNPPPNIEEFLTPAYLGPTAESLYPYIKRLLIEFWNPEGRYQNAVLAPNIGWGKEQSLDSKVYTPDGYTLMGDIQVGDSVSTPNGKTAKVAHIIPQGKKELFKFTFKDGRTTIAGAEHLWKVNRNSLKDSKNDNVWCIKTTKEIIEDGLYQNNKTGSPKWKVPLPNPVYHVERPHLIDPYTMGVLLGDGSLKDQILFTSIDENIINKVRESLIDSYYLGNTGIQYRLTAGYSRSSNKYREEIERLNLLGSGSLDKFIPVEYLYDSIENRIKLLQGLMDTDGTADKNGRIRFDTISKYLKDGVCELVRGLGGTASCKKHVRNSNSSRYENKEYIVFISFPNKDFPIFSLERKQKRVDNRFDRVRNRKGTQALSIVSIERLDEDLAQCITLDDEDHLYLTDGYTVTHNSFFTVIANLYLVTHLILMKNPKKSFGLSPATILTQTLISFTLQKANELLLEPFKLILQSASKFEYCRTTDTMEKKSKENRTDVFYWTTANPNSAITFSNGVNLKIASSPDKLLGNTILMGSLSEISFFKDKGFSDEYIMRIYNDLKGRIFSRFQNNYWARTILDSSPNDLENSIDRYVWEDAPKDDTNFIVTGAMWDWQPWKFTHLDKRFPIFRGSQSSPPKILREEEVQFYEPDEVIMAPEETRKLFEEDLLKSLKDLAGIPAGSSDRLITNKAKIEEIFTGSLKNVYAHIHAPANRAPEGLIFEQIKRKFFIDVGGGKYEFWRNPSAERFISADLSIKEDTTGITMSHVELGLDGSLIYVIDFNIPIVPDKHRINIDAVKFFIKELRDVGRLRINHVSFDNFQSESTMQYLKLHDFEVERLSVDLSTTPYLTFISLMHTNRVKAGRNLFLKNNLKSLILAETKGGKKKVDHLIGKLADVKLDSRDWMSSTLGWYAKDVSDATVASIILAQKYAPIPTYVWKEDENTVDHKETFMQNVASKYGLQAVTESS